MSKLPCNVLKISRGSDAPNAPPGCAPDCGHKYLLNLLVTLVVTYKK